MPGPMPNCAGCSRSPASATSRPEIVADAVEFGSFDHMRQLEETEAFASEKLRPGRHGDHDTYKTRRGTVGGHRDELTVEQIARLDEMLAASAASRFGYTAGG